MASALRLSTGVLRADQLPLAWMRFNTLMDELYPSTRGSSFHGLSTSEATVPSKAQLANPLCGLRTHARLNHDDLSRRASSFLFRKLLPSPPEARNITPYLNSMAREPTTPSPAFYKAASSAVNHIFRPGWDRDYATYVERATISKNSCTEATRKNGGARSYQAAVWSQDDFISFCLGRKDLPRIPDIRDVVQLDDGGKIRTVTVQSILAHLLLPLHLLLYDTLAKQAWLLVGDPTAKRLSAFRSRLGLIFVSGDYESATDNFNALNSRALLVLIAATSSRIPPDLWESASLSLQGTLRYKPKQGPAIFGAQRTGQLMGNFLSFPLLCLTNFIGVVMAFGLPRALKMPLLINGDDIVFQSTECAFRRWSSSVKEAGLTLSKGKTLTHECFFSINSTFFTATSSRVRLLPVVRPATLFSQVDSRSHSSFAGRLSACASGFSGRRRNAIHLSFLRYHRKLARTFAGSFRKQRIVVHPSVLHDTHLLTRELELLSTHKLMDLPTRTISRPLTEEERPGVGSFSDLESPLGFRSFPAQRVLAPKVCENLLGRLFVHNCWNARPTVPQSIHGISLPPTGLIGHLSQSRAFKPSYLTPTAFVLSGRPYVPLPPRASTKLRDPPRLTTLFHKFGVTNASLRSSRYSRSFSLCRQILPSCRLPVLPPRQLVPEFAIADMVRPSVTRFVPQASLSAPVV